jgi:4-hydroxy-3-methylbut-2-enyl diphosphate reductase
MEINLAKTAGFCFGVKRAIKIALETAKKDTPIEMLGDIVHNENVIKQLSKKGIQKVSELSTGKEKTLIIRAHGAERKTFEQAKKLGYSIVDATCPMVTEIHNIVKEMENSGHKIIIIGDKNHAEVKGIEGQLSEKPFIISNRDSIPYQEVEKIKKAVIVIQSTQMIENAEEIHEALKPLIDELKFFNTLCKTTKSKQAEIKMLPLENDVIIIIGSRTSANTNRLYQISKSLNEKTYQVMSEKEIDPSWFKGAQKVGVSTGASTPDEAIESVLEYLKKLK